MAHTQTHESYIKKTKKKMSRHNENETNLFVTKNIQLFFNFLMTHQNAKKI